MSTFIGDKPKLADIAIQPQIHNHMEFSLHCSDIHDDDHKTDLL